MAFTQKLPEWNAPGVEPSESQKQTGFQPGVKPPAQWFNWHLNSSYLALKELQEKAAEKSYVDTELGTIQADIQQLQEDVQNADIPDASLTVKGKVKLSNKTDGTSQTDAATEKAVNDARLAAATDATTKANTAETNATNYANTNFRKPSDIVNANLVKNSSALLGFDYWTNTGAVPFERFINQTIGGFFGINAAVASGQYAVLDNEAIGVSPGANYLLQAVFHTSGSYATSPMFIEVKNASTGINIDSLSANPQAWWHRKTKVITIPAGVDRVYLRLVVTNAPAGVTKGVGRIKFSEIMNSLNQDMPYTDEFATRALYEGVEAAKQSGVDAKNGIVGAINAKGGSASTSDPWASLATKIGQIQTGPKYATGSANASSAYRTFRHVNGTISNKYIEVTGLGFRPNRILLMRNDGTTYTYNFVTYSKRTRNAEPSATATNYNYAMYSDGSATTGYYVYEMSGSAVSADSGYVNDSSFLLPLPVGVSPYIWEAFGV